MGTEPSLIEQTLRYELEGEVSLDFARDGLRVSVSMPLKGVRVEDGSEGAGRHPRRDRWAGGDRATMRGKAVLVVEDEYLIGEEATAALCSAGCTVRGPVGTLPEALRIAVSEDLDAAVLDIKLGNSLVWPAARALKARGIPFVFATGYSDTFETPTELKDIRRLEKPLAAEDLVAMLSDVVAAQDPG